MSAKQIQRKNPRALTKAQNGARDLRDSENDPRSRAGHGSVGVPVKLLDSGRNYMEARKEFDRRLLLHYTPATVFTNEDLEIVHTRGNVNRYLKLAPGRAGLSILKVAREGLLMDLRNALNRSKKENVSVRKQNVQIKNGYGDGESKGLHPVRFVRFEVVPITVGKLKEQYFMIIFQDEQPEPRRRRGGQRAKMERESESLTNRMAKLEQELAATKGYLQSVIEAQEVTNVLRKLTDNGGCPSNGEAASLHGKAAARGLSPRELEVVRFLADGHSNKQIAALLNLSTRTVEAYRARSMGKLELHSIGELVRYAIRNQLIQP